MPWNSAAVNGGFSQANTWLPVAAEHLPKAVDMQDADKNSVLNAYRKFLAWRKTQPALLHGDIEFLDAPIVYNGKINKAMEALEEQISRVAALKRFYRVLKTSCLFFPCQQLFIRAMEMKQQLNAR